MEGLDVSAVRAPTLFKRESFGGTGWHAASTTRVILYTYLTDE